METQQHMNEGVMQCKFCRGEGDANIWGARNSDDHDKHVQNCHNCQVLKGGHLFLSSKGIGWTSWKKRWFILTRTSLVFFRSDPNAPSQKGGEVNLTLGGIDLNNSGSVVVRADKKLLTVLFPDGRDGRAFTLKAETLEDMNEWKTALENALAEAPSAALVMGQTGMFRNDAMESIETSFEQWRDKRSAKSMIVGRPILLALEDIDGSPSFLEKALRFIEQYGIKVEGILRQSADVEEVEYRVQEYEKGKKEFYPNEDAHVIGDCIKHVLRELPSSPVPVSCCTALLEAFRSDRRSRIGAMRAVVSEILPEPNRCLLQRVLKMMRLVASHKSENRMTVSAVAACMAPLLLRPLLAGDCELEDGFDLGGDGSIQLLQAAAAANHAQAIVIILLEEYEKIFNEDAFSSELCSGSEDCDSEDEDDDGDESTDDEILEDEGYHDAQNDLDQLTEEDPENTSSGSLDESGSDLCGDLYDIKAAEDHDSRVASPKFNNDVETTQKYAEIALSTVVQRNIKEEQSCPSHYPLSCHDSLQHSSSSRCEDSALSAPNITDSQEYLECIRASPSSLQTSVSNITPSCVTKFTEKLNAPVSKIKPPTVWGRTSARKNLSLESIDYSVEDDNVIQRLETAKSDLQVKVTREVQGNAMLQASLEKRKETLHERRLALEEDVKRLQEQLRKEKELRTSLEAGLMNMRPGHVSLTSVMDPKVRGDLEEIALAEADAINLKHKVAELRGQLNQQCQLNPGSLCLACGQQLKDQSKCVQNSTSTHHRRNPSGKETTRFGSDYEHLGDPPEESSVSMKGTPSENNDSSVKETSSIGARANSKRPIRGEDNLTGIDHDKVKALVQEKSPPDKQPAQKHQPNVGGVKSSNEEQTTARQTAAPRKASRAEPSEDHDAASASSSSSSSSTSALSRLTHRLNFLRERRSQLANELQTLEVGPTMSPESK